jgi:hypothetical protein
LRGTGYFWLEYIDDSQADHRSLLLLVQGKRPLFADRADVSTERLTCADQTVVADQEIEPQGKRISFDCHVVDDEPNPAGELTVGLVDDTRPGLKKPLSAWRAVVYPQGKGGEIGPIETSRVLCTVLPGIDSR